MECLGKALYPLGQSTVPKCSFVDSRIGTVVGENGTILHTTTGGEEIASWKIPRIDPALSHSSPVQ